ncbi:hypothetical protein HN51_028711, partial [Arachis hypogaea]
MVKGPDFVYEEEIDSEEDKDVMSDEDEADSESEYEYSDKAGKVEGSEGWRAKRVLSNRKIVWDEDGETNTKASRFNAVMGSEEDGRENSLQRSESMAWIQRVDNSQPQRRPFLSGSEMQKERGKMIIQGHGVSKSQETVDCVPETPIELKNSTRTCMPQSHPSFFSENWRTLVPKRSNSSAPNFERSLQPPFLFEVIATLLLRGQTVGAGSRMEGWRLCSVEVRMHLAVTITLVIVPPFAVVVGSSHSFTPHFPSSLVA